MWSTRTANAQERLPLIAMGMGSAMLWTIVRTPGVRSVHPCNDNDLCTTNDVLNANCQCAGTLDPDTDGDGVCDTQDNCANIPGQIGSRCNDGDPCTINDVLNSNCMCVGTPSGDSDGDGICNATDNCPNVPGQVGSPATTTTLAPRTISSMPTANALEHHCRIPMVTVCATVRTTVARPGQIGVRACNDNDPCTVNDVLNSNCMCRNPKR